MGNFWEFFGEPVEDFCQGFLGIFVWDFWWINWEFLVGVFAWGFLGFLDMPILNMIT